jgi:hypothetical protein
MLWHNKESQYSMWGIYCHLIQGVFFNSGLHSVKWSISLSHRYEAANSAMVGPALKRLPICNSTWRSATQHGKKNWIFSFFATIWVLFIRLINLKFVEVLSPTRKETSYSDRRFWVSYTLFIIIIGGILILYNKTNIKRNILTIK